MLISRRRCSELGRQWVPVPSEAGVAPNSRGLALGCGMLKSDGVARQDWVGLEAGAVMGSFGPVRPTRQRLDSR
jgi:hypothetical protein